MSDIFWHQFELAFRLWCGVFLFALPPLLVLFIAWLVAVVFVPSHTSQKEKK